MLRLRGMGGVNSIMATTTPVCNQTDFQELIRCYEDEINNAYRGKNRHDVEMLLKEAFHAIEERTEVSSVLDKDRARAEAIGVIQGVEEQLGSFSSGTDVSDLLTQYSQGYSLYQTACGNGLGNGEPLCATLNEKHANLYNLINRILQDDHPRLDWIRRYSQFSPFLYYTTSGGRGGAGFGFAAELLAPISQLPVAGGVELQLVTYPAFDDPLLFSGEIKTWETFISPPLLQIGYQGEKATALLQGGFWFTGYRLFEPRAATNPYSKNPFENPNFQVGIKTYLLGNKVRIAGGYQHSVWGPGGYGEIGYLF